MYRKCAFKGDTRGLIGKCVLVVGCDLAQIADLQRNFDIRVMVMAGVLALSGVGASAVEPGPNVLLVVASEFGWQDLPSHGGDRSVETPALDRIVDEGMELSRFYACPDGAPTRASLLTGRYHYRTGVAGDTHGENVMHGYEITLAEVLRDNGYATASFGAWRNGRNWPSNALGQGFETVNGNEGVRAAIEFIMEPRDEAFFCLVGLAGSGLQQVEGEFGRLLSALDNAAAAANTIVIFTSDCGSGQVPSVTTGDDDKALPRFFGPAESVHEAGVRVPFLIRWPGQIPMGADSREVSTSIDLLPTLVEFCQATFVETLPVDGISLAELLRTGGKPRRWPNRILFTSSTPPGYDVKNAGVAVRTGRWLAVRDTESSRAKSGEDRDAWELYDLLSDPYQRYNVAEEYWSLAGHMSADFMFWMKHTTEHGLGPIPTELGHVEWPVVELHVDDRPFDVVKKGEFRWPVDVVEGGEYRVRIVLEDAAPDRSREVTLRCLGAEIRQTLAQGETVLELISLPKGLGELELEIGAAESLRAVVIETK